MTIPLSLHTPFSLLKPTHTANRDGVCQVNLRAGVPALVLHLSTWQEELPAFSTTLLSIIKLPPNVGDCEVLKVSGEAIAMCMRTSPYEFDVIAKTLLPQTQALKNNIVAAIPSNLGSWLDLSHARCFVEISGVKTCDTLSKLFALDFRLNVFPVGQAKLSGTHHAPVTLYRSALDVFDLWVHTSFAESLYEVFLDAALEFGVNSRFV